MQRQITRVSVKLKLINEFIERKANRDLKKYGVTLSQMRILMALDCAEGKLCQMKNLEQLFDLSQQNLVGLVKRLQKKKLVETAVDPGDRRRKIVIMTDKGYQLCRMLYKEAEEIDAWIAEDMTEREKEDFGKLLEIVYGRVKKKIKTELEQCYE